MQTPNPLTSLLKIEYPVIQGAMLGVSTPAMAAAVSNSLGLGSLAVGGLSAQKTLELVLATKQLTDKPFAVNLFAHQTDVAVNPDEFEAMQDHLEKVHHDNQIPFERKQLSDLKFNHYSEQVELLIHESVPIVSFTFGILSADVIARFKSAGTILIGTATCVKEAQLLEAAGVDMIVAQGIEAGGHRGTFLTDEPLPQVGLMALVPQICDVVKIPVIAAGGIFDGRTANAAYTLGAQGIQVGSIFIPAHESVASAAYKDAVLTSADTGTSLTRAFSGRWARGVTNDFMRQMDTSSLTIPYYTYQNNLTTPLRDFGRQHNLQNLISLWAGQAAGNGFYGSTADIFDKLVNDIGFNS